MTKLEAILRDVQLLSAEERLDLLAVLHEQTPAALDEELDGAAIGRRGLAAWTESARGEDWSAFYPDTLRNGQGPTA